MMPAHERLLPLTIIEETSLKIVGRASERIVVSLS